MSQLKNVTEVEPEIRVMGEIVSGGETHFGFVTGLPMSARENEAFDNLKGKFFSSDNADEAILLMDFAKELDAKDPAGLIGKDITLRYGERQALAQEPSDRPAMNGEGSSGGDDYGFSVVRKQQPLRVVGVIDQEPYGGMRTVSRGRIFLPVRTTERLNRSEE